MTAPAPLTAEQQARKDQAMANAAQILADWADEHPEPEANTA